MNLPNRLALYDLRQPPRKRLLSTLSYFVLFTFFFGQTTHVADASATSHPCPYSQTVNITDGLRLKDGSYSFEGLLIPANLTAEYDVKVIDGIEYSTANHMRGCACLLKPCITFCCDHQMHYDYDHENCTANTKNSHSQHVHIEITLKNGTVRVVNINESFVVRYEFGCKVKMVEKERADFWKWDLFENGTLKRDNRFYNTDEFCFTPLEHKKTWSLTPLTCARFRRGFRVWIYAICTTLAIIMNAGIILMFVATKEMRNSTYGQGLIFHLFFLTLGLGFLVYLHLQNPENQSHTACRNIGFLAYFFMLVSTFILNVISGSFWATFSSTVIKIWYMKIMYGVAIVLGLILKYVATAVQDSSVSRNIKPGIGEDFCWFDTRLWGIVLFLYIPILISLAVSIFCAQQAYSRTFDLPSDTVTVAGEDFQTTRKHLSSYAIYLLVLFCIWLREIFVYILARVRENFFIIDYWSGICVLGLSSVGFVFLLCRNKFILQRQRLHVSDTVNEPEDFSLPPPYSEITEAEAKKNSR